jgi:carbon monoxide dehydrogenase subunit G
MQITADRRAALMELDHEFTVPVPVDRAWPVLLDPERVAPCVPGATLDSVDGGEFTGRLKVKLGAMTITYRGAARLVVTDESARIVTIEGSAKEARGTGTAAATVTAQLHAEGDGTRVTVLTKLNITGRPAQFGRNILAEVGAKLISRFAKALAEELQAIDEERSTAPAAEEPPPVAEPGAGIAEPAPTVLDEQASAAEAPERRMDLPRAPETIPDGFSVPEQAAPPAGESSTGEGAGAAVEPVAEATDRAPVTPRPARRSGEAIDLLEVAGPSVVKRAAPIFGGIVALLTVRYLFRRRRGRHHR